LSENQALNYALALEDASREFSAAYMDLRNLRGLIDKDPDQGDMRIADAVAAIVREQRYSSQRMSRLLYRECSKSLSAIGFGCSDHEISRHSVKLLIEAASSCKGPASIEASGGLGVMPFDTHQYALPHSLREDIPNIDFTELLEQSGAVDFIDFSGRSAIFSKRAEDNIFVIKFARKGEKKESLHLEGKWMEFAADFPIRPGVRFDCPRPFKSGSAVLFRITGIDMKKLSAIPGNLDPEHYAMAYSAHKDYFRYPNDSREGELLSFDSFLEVMCRNSFLLGCMSGEGIIHEAPIPLFHNRVQAMRRTDAGVYQWHLFGRLDRWLDSCEFPNFGVSGLRDFEHLRFIEPGRDSFHRGVGAHFLSILLVIGSWFRAANPKMRGFDKDGLAVDARALFDRDKFCVAVERCFKSYYEGFCGRSFDYEIDLNIGRLVDRMIDEMGVDRHMHEFMRVADQDMLDEREFKKYLISCGMDELEADDIKKGEQDIRLVTGPHLGDFNRAISLPEIVEWSAMAAGCCIAAKSLGDRWGTLVAYKN
jgi:hypothetical protein